MKKLYAKIQRYWNTRRWKKIKTDGLGLVPYDFPDLYLSFNKLGFADQELTNRNASVYSRIADIGEALEYLGYVHDDIRNGTMSNRMTAPGKIGKGRVMRADAFMYNSKEGMYVTMTDVMELLSSIYSDLRAVESDTSHSYHHRVKSFVRPVVDQLHEIFIETLK